MLPILQVIGDSLDAIEAQPSLADVDWDALKIARIRQPEFCPVRGLADQAQGLGTQAPSGLT